MLTFSWTGKRKKKSDASDHAGSVMQKHKSVSDHDSSEPSVSRSTTSTDSIHFGHATPYTSSAGTSFKEAEYSGRLLLHGLRLNEFPVEAFANVDLLDIVFIDLSENRLTTLPADFSLFDCLISCIANSNRFRTIPTCICSIEQLTYIDFSCNDISHLPDGLFDLPLKTLLLGENNISFVPEAIRRLAPTLACLDLSRNELRSLQTHLKYLKSLKVLKLAKNRIEEFPPEFCTSLELRTLDMSQNDLSFLPLDMIKMTDLRTLNLSSNPLKSPPIEVIDRGIVHIFKWLEGRTSGSSSSVGSKDCLDRKRSTISAEKEKHHHVHNESRIIHHTTEPPKHHNVEIKNTTTSGNMNSNRPKEVVEPKLVDVASKPHVVQIVHNKISSVPSQSNGKENLNLKLAYSDEQNNNSAKSHLTNSNISSPGLTKKPISKVAPMIKGTTARPVSSGVNGNTQTKIGTLRRPTPVTGTNPKSVPNTITKKEIPVSNKTRVSSAVTRKSEEPTSLKNVRKPTSASTTVLNKPAGRVMHSPPINDVETAKKLMREKLGAGFVLSKGDISFSQQLSDGVELCKFVNKIQPDSILLASPTDSAISTTRSKLNVERFVQYCKKAGVPEATICSPLDILSKRNPQKVARTILSVVKLQPSHILPTKSIHC